MEEIELRSVFFYDHNEACKYINEQSSWYPDTFKLQSILGNNEVGYTVFYYV